MGKVFSVIGYVAVAVVVVLIVASIVIPAPHGSAITRNESSATAFLKSAVFSTQCIFQASGSCDADANEIGEYGFFQQLAGVDGQVNTSIYYEQNNEIRLEEDATLDAHGRLESKGYYFKIYLPDGRDGMYDFKAYQDDKEKSKGAPLREQYFMVLAWPVELNETGRRIFCMMQDGQLHSMSSVGRRDAFLKKPGWEHFLEEAVSFEESLESGPLVEHWQKPKP